MDRLLDKLRHNMAELSVQGDDFTRQIWHMYATFEEFIDTHTMFGKPGEGGMPSSHVELPLISPTPVTKCAPSGVPSRRHVGRRRSRAGSNHRLIGGSALELAGSRRTDTSPSTPISSSAPAAATNERFTFDTKDDIGVGGYRKPHHRCRYRRSRRRMDNPLLETISTIQDACDESDDHDYGDPHACFARDRHFRFGSDPDRDSIGYAGSNSIDSGYKSSCPTPEPLEGVYYGNLEAKRGSVASQSGSQQQNQRPRIPMGTKVMNRHSHPRYVGRDLDHLMYLRQSILSAMQRYEQQAVVSCPSLGFRPRSSSASSPCSGPSSGRGSSPLQQRRGSYMASYPGSRTHSPGCYSSASYGSGVSSPGYQTRARFGTAEEDIDSLLHGRFDELQSTYVTMIEDKYRHSSIARVKKLREKNHRKGPAADSSGSSSDSSCQSPPPNSPPPGRFSEVAKCMLEIIEDLQNQTQLAPAPPDQATEDLGAEACPPPPPAPGLSSFRASGSVPATDYHVYEEIMYELTMRPAADPAPPPLPARPDTIFRPSKRHPPQPHRPKQRSNLYSLFQEPGARRDISQSLEQEFLGAMGNSGEVGHRPTHHERTAEEEYGFRMPT